MFFNFSKGQPSFIYIYIRKEKKNQRKPKHRKKDMNKVTRKCFGNKESLIIYGKNEFTIR